MKVLRLLFSPVVFALGFLAPLAAQILNELSVQISGVPNLALGLALALAIGITAQVRGGWLWHSSKAR